MRVGAGSREQRAQALEPMRRGSSPQATEDEATTEITCDSELIVPSTDVYLRPADPAATRDPSSVDMEAGAYQIRPETK